jgi:transposase InsO family protein
LKTSDESALYLGPEYSDVVFAALLRKRDEQGGLTNHRVRSAAKMLGKGESTLWGWLAAGKIPKNERPHYVATERDVDALFDMDGSVAAAHRLRRREAGENFPSYDTYLRALKAALDPADFAEAKHGPRGADKFKLRIPVSYETRDAVLHVDAMQFDVPTIAKGWHKARYPWVVSAFWGGVRGVGGYSVTFLHPTQDDVLEAIYRAIVKDSNTPFFGVPDAIKNDNGSEETANAVQLAEVMIGADAIVNEPYQPHLNGVLERWHRTLKQEFEIGKPHNRNGPKKRDGKTTEWPAGYYIDHDDFVDCFDDYIYEYNWKRKHSSLGMTPAQAWEEQTGANREIDPALARRFMSQSKVVKVGDFGINVNGSLYWNPELIVGTEVEVHFGNDRRSVEVYENDEWLLTAKIADAATVDDLSRLLELRVEQDKERSGHRARRRKSKQIRVKTRSGEGESRLVSGMTRQEVHNEINARLDPEAVSPEKLVRKLRLDEHGNRVPING